MVKQHQKHLKWTSESNFVVYMAKINTSECASFLLYPFNSHCTASINPFLEHVLAILTFFFNFVFQFP